MKRLKLFQGLTTNEIKNAIERIDARKKLFQKGEYVFLAGDRPKYIGALLSGQLHITADDKAGNKVVISSIGGNEIFGEAFVCSGMNEYKINVEAVKNSEVLLVPYEKIINNCSSECEYHPIIIKNLLELVSSRNIELQEKISCLTQRTTRAKVAFYLLTQYNHMENTNIVVPFNREELSDYLSVNRSALSRELSKLKEEGIITFTRNKFELLDLEALESIVSGD